ncbi:MAG TPA: hypothetical protein DCW29_25120 [Janthinobacterium sp.]|nr:hypothetical protein [Janthinobacterium sp.]
MVAHIHRIHRSGWLRAAVLGANDGLLSISSLTLGVASAHSDHHDILVAGLAGLVAGVIAMGAGEYVSVSSQAEIERADIEIEKYSLKHEYEQEQRELSEIYVCRGLDPELAARVAQQLMAHDAIGAHVRDEIGISAALSARPLQAALASAASFAGGALVPLLVAFFVRGAAFIPATSLLSLLFLALLGALSARVGGAPVLAGTLRVLILGALAMAITSLVGTTFGVVV